MKLVTAKRAVRAISIIVVFGFVSKILGFVREMVIARFYGATAATDAFNIAFNIPGLILAGLGGAIATTFIPAFTRKAEQEGKQAAFALSRKLMTGFAMVGLLLCGLAIVFAPALTHLLAPKFDPAKTALAAKLSRILLTAGVFTILSGLAAGLLQAQERFTMPALIGFPFSLIIIAVVGLFARRYGIYALAVGTAISMAVQFMFLVPAIVRTGFNFKPSFDFRDPEVQRVAALTLPVFAGSMLLQVNTIVDRMFASGLPVGSISALNYASKVNGMIVSIVATGIATVALPALSLPPRTKTSHVCAARCSWRSAA